MGGGSGGGLFEGTMGALASKLPSGGRLLAMAEQVSPPPDASGEHLGGIGEALSWLLEKLRPWQFLPNDHPEKIRRIQELKEALGPLCRDMANGFIGMNNLPATKEYFITNFAMAVANWWKERQRKEAEEKR